MLRESRTFRANGRRGDDGAGGKGERVEQETRRPLQMKEDFGGADRFNPIDVPEICGVRRNPRSLRMTRVEDPVEGEQHGRRLERGAVVEEDAAPKAERRGEAVLRKRSRWPQPGLDRPRPTAHHTR